MLKLVASKLVFLVLLSASTNVFADNAQGKILTLWYQALSSVDHDVISNLLSDEAVIELQDYDIVQSKSEFISSLDSWEDAIEGGSIKFRMKDNISSDKTTTAIVCYTFSSNQLMTEETFKFSDEKIMNSVQATIAEDCNDF